MTTPLYDLTPLVVSHAPQVPDPIAAQCLLLTARDLCKDTGCWRYEATDIPVTAGDPLASIYDLPADSQIYQVQAAVLGDVPLRRVAIDQLYRERPTWFSDQGAPFGFFLGAERNQLRLVVTPDTDGSLYTQVALMPTLTAATLDSVFLDRHLDLLVDGALSRLLRYPDRAWTNLNLAGVYAARFEQSKRVIRAQAADGFQPGVPRSVCYGGL